MQLHMNTHKRTPTAIERKATPLCNKNKNKPNSRQDPEDYWTDTIC